MPHLVILYSPNLEASTDVGGLCKSLATAMVEVRDDEGRPVFPVGGVRVFAYPAAYAAVADGSGDYGFMYFNLRMARGRPPQIQTRAGQAVTDAAKAYLAPLLAQRRLGLTLQVDEGDEVFDAKFGNLHALFAQKAPGP